MSYRSFYNEARRKVRISVGAGVRGAMPLVHIIIQGPYSTSENEVTRREAEELYSALGEHLAEGDR